MQTISRPLRLVRVFAWAFGASVITTALVIKFPFLVPEKHPLPGEELGGQGLVVGVMLASIVSATVSLLGFFASNYFAWRKERRDRVQFDLTIELQRAQLEKLTNELAELRKDKVAATMDFPALDASDNAG